MSPAKNVMSKNCDSVVCVSNFNPYTILDTYCQLRIYFCLSLFAVFFFNVFFLLLSTSQRPIRSGCLQTICIVSWPHPTNK